MNMGSGEWQRKWKLLGLDIKGAQEEKAEVAMGYSALGFGV